MRERIRSHLTYANVVASLALFLVLGGGTALASYVVSSNSQVGPNTISGHKPPSGDHANILSGSVNGTDLATASVSSAKLAPNSVNATKVLDGSLTASDTDASSIQHRLDGGCASGSAIQSVDVTGASTCAATGFTQVTVRSAQQAGTTSTASCNSDETLIGGGGDSGGSGATLVASKPGAQVRQWTVTTTGGNETAYALCAK